MDSDTGLTEDSPLANIAQKLVPIDLMDEWDGRQTTMIAKMNEVVERLNYLSGLTLGIHAAVHSDDQSGSLSGE